MNRNEIEKKLKDYLKEVLNIKEDKIIEIKYKKENNYINYEVEMKISKWEWNRILDCYYGSFLTEKKDSYIMGFVLPLHDKIYNSEYDRSKEAFEFYVSVYDNKIECINNKYYYRFGEKSIIEIKGDIDINFKMQKINYFFDILDNVESKSRININKLKNELWKCHERMYEPLNISIMPTSGGLNVLKQTLGFDRLDVFFHALKQYYVEGVSSYIFNFGRNNMAYSELRTALKNFLDSFNCNDDKKQAIYKFCKEIYHIENKKLVDEMCDFGAKAILCPDDIKNYMKLVSKYWRTKEQYYKKSNNRIKTAYQKMLQQVCHLKGKEYINTFTNQKDCYICE